MADIAFRSVASASDVTLTVSTINVGVPAGAVAGDGQTLWHSAVVITGGGAPAQNTPAGWTVAGTGTFINLAGLDGRVTCYARIAGSSEAAVTLDAGVNAAQVGVRCAYTGADFSNWASSITALFGSLASGTSHVVPSITTDKDRQMASYFIAAFVGGTTWTAPGGTTERTEVESSAISDEVRATAGATGTRTFTSSAATVSFYGVAVFNSSYAAARASRQYRARRT